MSREQKITGFIIKTQDLGEADLLLTFFSESFGKERVLVKSAKKMISKLRGKLQPFSELEITLVGNGSLAKVIGVETLNQYPNLISSQSHMHALQAMQELVIRSLADQQANLPLYNLYSDSLKRLEGASDEEVIFIVLGFFVQALRALGFSPQLLEGQQENTYFSVQDGKFTNQSHHSDDWQLSLPIYDLYLKIHENGFHVDWENYKVVDAARLLSLLSHFAGYQLERELRSTQYFNVV